MGDTENLEHKLDGLKSEHRDLDEEIAAMNTEINPNKLQIQRLKKRKLLLRDKIAWIESALCPNIIA